MVGPAVAALCLVGLYPFLFALRLSFTDATLYNFTDVAWVGLGNYLSALRDPGVRYSLLFTVAYALGVSAVETVAGYLLALVIWFGVRGTRVLVSAILAPMMVAPLVWGLSFRLMLNEFFGVVPYYLNKLGLSVNFFGNPLLSLVTVVVMDVLQWTPFTFIVAYAGLQGVPDSVLDAAKVDGAPTGALLRHIVTPLMAPTLGVAFLLRHVDALKVFDTIYITTGGGPGESTKAISLALYERTFNQFQLGEMAAVTVMVLILTSLLLRPVVRRLETGGQNGR